MVITQNRLVVGVVVDGKPPKMNDAAGQSFSCPAIYERPFISITIIKAMVSVKNMLVTQGAHFKTGPTTGSQEESKIEC
jgi:hypothetical protein